MQNKTANQAQMLANRLQKRFRHLKKWAGKTGVEAFRIYDRDIPEVPLVLDFYGDVISGALYKRPYEKDEEEETQWLCAMKESVSAALGINTANIFLKQREKQRGDDSQYEKINTKKDSRIEKIINEGGLKFKVNLSDYLDTGLFIDRRLLRAMVRDSAKDKKVLNLFSYTGSFSVYAAAGGAVSTDSVDLSNTYLNWARENFELNGITAKQHKLIMEDVLEFIKKAEKEKKSWDVIIVDPPAFSNSKKMTDDFDLNRDLIKLLAQCLKLLSADGKIFVSVNLHRKAPKAQELENALLQALPHNKVRVTDLGNKIDDEDFKDKKMPKAFLIKEKID